MTGQELQPSEYLKKQIIIKIIIKIIPKVNELKAEKRKMGLKTVCDKKHANKHQVKEDQTHMPLPPEGTSHAILLVDIPLGKEQCMC